MVAAAEILRRLRVPFAALCLSVAGFSVPSTALGQPGAQAAPLFGNIDIPFETFRLPNGLTVVVHTDTSTPLVAVAVWYGVGSSHESSSNTGFAHLFEHLMFNGSANFNRDWFLPLQEVGATNMNGTTSYDRTYYYQTVPKTALDRVLWMESDRMIYLLGAVDQARLEEQRGVVKNEKRQREGRPLGLVSGFQMAALFPEGHPYHHTPIGSMADLDAASLDDVRGWFTDKYGATNAVLVLSGDITPAEAKEKVARYFGAAQPGKPVAVTEEAIPVRQSITRARMSDNVSQTRILRSWVAPGLLNGDTPALDLAAYVLGSGKNSRLYRALVEGGIATSVTASLAELRIASTFEVEVVLREDVSEVEALAAIDKVIATFLRDGPTPQELERAKTRVTAGYVRSLETLGGRASMLAQGQLYAGDPSNWRKRLIAQNAATGDQVLAAARKWLTPTYHEMVVTPFGRYAASKEAVDRTKGVPPAGDTLDLRWPKVEQASLSNGIPVYFIRRPGAPIVNVAISFKGGIAGDSVLGLPGAPVGSLAMASLTDGAGGKSAAEISAGFEDLAATFSASAGPDSSTVQFSALPGKLGPTVDLASLIVRHPDYPRPEFDRSMGRAMSNVEQGKASAGGKAVLAVLDQIYGPDHPYGAIATREAIARLQPDDFRAYLSRWIRPETAAIFVAGDTELAEILPHLERGFGDWKVSGPVGETVFPALRPITGSSVILIDQPGSAQTEIRAVFLGPRGQVGDEEALTAANNVMGGDFTSRINMNLRENKGWTYGARSSLGGELDQRLFIVAVPVQADKTAEAIVEIRKELIDLVGPRPINGEESSRAVTKIVRGLPGAFETTNSFLGSMMFNNLRGRPLDSPSTLRRRYEALDEAQLRTALSRYLNPSRIVWIIVGDLKRIEGPVRALGLGPVTILDVNDLGRGSPKGDDAESVR